MHLAITLNTAGGETTDFEKNSTRFITIFGEEEAECNLVASKGSVLLGINQASDIKYGEDLIPFAGTNKDTSLMHGTNLYWPLIVYYCKITRTIEMLLVYK